MLNEILMNYTIIQEIWQHHQESLMMSTILRKEGIENWQSIPLPCFSIGAMRKVQTTIRSYVYNWPCLGYLDLYWSGMTIPSYLHSEMHLNSLTKRNFKAEAEVYAKAKNLALVLQWIKRSKQPARWRTSSIQNQLREKISLITKNWIWRWQQNWSGATILLIWSTKLPSVEPWQAVGRKILTLSGRLKNVFSGRQLVLSKKTHVVLYTRMSRETLRTMWNEVERRKKFSPRASILFSSESEETDWRKKAWTVWRPVLRLKLQIPCLWRARWKTIVVWLSTLSRVSWLQVWKQLHSWLSLPMSTSWWWEQLQREVEKTVLKDQLLFWKNQKRPRLCISKTQTHEFYSTKSWRIDIERFGGTHLKFTECT